MARGGSPLEALIAGIIALIVGAALIPTPLWYVGIIIFLVGAVILVGLAVSIFF
jgi:hypothetical protein